MFNPVAPYRDLLTTLYCLWHISQIQTCLCVVVGTGFVSTSPAFMSSDIHPAGPHPRLAQKTVIEPPWPRAVVSTQFAQQSARTAVVSPPLVGCVDWRIYYISIMLSFFVDMFYPSFIYSLYICKYRIYLKGNI